MREASFLMVLLGACTILFIGHETGYKWTEGCSATQPIVAGSVIAVEDAQCIAQNIALPEDQIIQKCGPKDLEAARVVIRGAKNPDSGNQL